MDLWQEERNVKEDKQSFSLFLIRSTVMQTKQNQWQMLRSQDKYQIHWRPEQDALYWIHLSTAQDAGLEFWQTGSNDIITYQSVPKECVVNAVSESGKRELFARQLTPRERPNVTLRPSWVHTRSNTVSMPREPRVICRPGTLTRVLQGVVERGNRTICWSQSRRHLQRRNSHGRTCKESQNKPKNLWLQKRLKTTHLRTIFLVRRPCVLVGEIKMEVDRRSLRIFFQSQEFAPTKGNCRVCDGRGVHTLRVARTLFWHIFFAWRTDIAHTHGSRCLQCGRHISPSHPLHSHVPSAVLAVPARPLGHLVPVFPFFAELFPIRKRGSGALPQRREVWLPGRYHALHIYWSWIPLHYKMTSLWWIWWRTQRPWEECDGDRESRRLFRTKVVLVHWLFEFFCGSFSDLAHEPCIKGANHVRGGV